jgi:hypothetical protein
VDWGFDRRLRAPDQVKAARTPGRAARKCGLGSAGSGGDHRRDRDSCFPLFSVKRLALRLNLPNLASLISAHARSGS